MTPQARQIVQDFRRRHRDAASYLTRDLRRALVDQAVLSLVLMQFEAAAWTDVRALAWKVRDEVLAALELVD